MVATQNIDTLGPIWTFSLRGVLTFVASDLDINGCVLFLRGQQIYIVIQAVHSLLYIVAKCHSFSVVVTNPVHGLPLTHHQRSLAHHMDSCTTLTVALHLRLQLPSPIALMIHTLNTELIALNTQLIALITQPT